MIDRNTSLAGNDALRDELLGLVDACCDERAAPEDVERLEQLLQDNPDAVQIYLDYIGVHTTLDWSATSREIAAEVQPSGYSEVEIARPDGEVNGQLSRLMVGLLAISALLLIAFFPTWNQSTKVPVELAATLSALVSEHSDDARWNLLRSDGSSDGMHLKINANDTIHLTSGQLQLDFEDGAEVTLTGPAVLRVLSPSKAEAISGKLTAHVNDEAIGFSVDTPRANVVDLGTRFGLEVDDLGQTDVVVFEGEVDVSYGPMESLKMDWASRVMQIGEAVRVDDQGSPQRIMSIESAKFNLARSAMPVDGKLLITEVVDNIRGLESWNYYEIVRQGMREDAKAFVDRAFHEWNGVDQGGIPDYLIGGDYVKMFNNDKFSKNYEVSVSIAHPATLYVLFDDRIKVAPAWLQEQFVDTGDNIGIDRGPYQYIDGRLVDGVTGVGPGDSVEDTLSIWSRTVNEPSTIKLGSTEAQHNYLNMYGIVATELQD